MLSLEELDEFTDRSHKPTSLEFIHYIFWEKGISLEEFNRLPIPYIMSVARTYAYVKAEEEKAAKKARKN